MILAKPAGADAAGLYRVPLDGKAMSWIASPPGVLSPSQDKLAYVGLGQVYVQDLASGTRWAIPSGGHMVQFSPDGSRVAWEVASNDVTNLDRRRWDLWVAGFEGKDSHMVVSGIGGGFIGWTPNGAGWVFSGRLTSNGDSGVWVKDSSVTQPRLVFPAGQIRSPLLSPGRGWLAVTVAFSGNENEDGLWLVRIGSTGSAKRLPAYGSYRWGGENELLVIPLSTGAEGLPLVAFDAATGSATTVLGLAAAGIPIANNTWLPAPNGRSMAYLSADDMSLWVVALPRVTGSP